MDMLDELTDTALIVESFALYIFAVALVRENYPDTGIEESLFTESSQESIVVIYGMLEYLAVGLEHNACTCLICLADYFERFVIMATLETLEMDIFTVLDSKLKPFGKGIYNGSADTGTGSKKVKILDQFNISTGYNFLADSLNMSNVGITMSTSIFGKLGLNGNMNFDPYAINDHGQRINKFNIVETGVPLRLTNISASLSYSLSGKGAINGNDGSKSGKDGGSENAADYYRRIYYHPVTNEYIPGGWLYYTNPNVPWSVNFSYSYSLSKQYSYTNEKLVKRNNITQTLGISGNVQLTPKMSFQFTSGYDFTALKMSTTQISARYDLHCFNIAVSWVPTGNYKSYNFIISANAAALADLLRFKKSTSYWDR